MIRIRARLFQAAPLLLFAALPAWSNIDNRLFQSPVRDQQHRGTCTAFAVAGALEALPGMPTALSVQYLYAIMKKTQYAAGAPVTDGDQLGRYVPVLQNYGIPAELFMPYDGSPENSFARRLHNSSSYRGDEFLHYLCQTRESDDRILRTSPYGKYHISSDSEVIDQSRVSDVDGIKRILDDLGPGRWVRSLPTSYALFASHWTDRAIRGNIDLDSHVLLDVHTLFGTKRYTLRQAMQMSEAALGGKLLNLLASRAAEIVSNVPGEKIEGHAIEIVGYDDTGFIIKNSWGTSWGNQGYGKISFDYHRAFATQALAIRSGWTKPAVANPAQLLYAQYRLKVFYDADRSNMSLSTYTMDKEDPSLASVRYQVFFKGILGDWVPYSQLPLFTSAPGQSQWNSGYGAFFPNVFNLPTQLAAVVTYTGIDGRSTTRTYLDIGRAGMHDHAPYFANP